MKIFLVTRISGNKIIFLFGLKTESVINSVSLSSTVKDSATDSFIVPLLSLFRVSFLKHSFAANFEQFFVYWDIFRSKYSEEFWKMTLFVMRCAIWYHLYNLKNVKSTHGEVLLSVKLQALACNFTESNTLPWVFFTFLKLCKWYQIAQSITFTRSGIFKGTYDDVLSRVVRFVYSKSLKCYGQNLHERFYSSKAGPHRRLQNRCF